MNVVGKVSSFISQGMYSVATPFHPFGGAVDIIVVKQHDGTFRSTPWYVRFGKFQGVLKGAEKLVKIEVNGVESNFHMFLDNSGEAYFVREVDNEGLKASDNLEVKREDSNENDYNNLDVDRVGRDESDSGRMFYDFQDEQSSLEDSLEFSEYGSGRYDTLDSVEHALETEDSNSEVVLVSVDGHILTAPISERDCDENLQLNTPQFHLGPGEGTDYLNNLDDESAPKEVGNENVCEENSGTQESGNNCTSSGLKKDEAFKSCLELSELSVQFNNGDQENMGFSVEDPEKKSPRSPLRNGENERWDREVLGIEDECSKSEHSAPCAGDPIKDMESDLSTRLEISLCGNLLHAGMGSHAAENAFNANLISPDEFKFYSASIVKDENLIVRLQGKYLRWDKAARIILGMAAFGLDLPVEPKDIIPVEVEKSEAKEYDSEMPSTPSRRWRLWPIPFRRVKTIEHTDSSTSNEEISVDPESDSLSQPLVSTPTARVATESPRKKSVRTNVPTTDQIASLNLKEGQNMVKFTFSTRVLGTQKVEAHIYLWRWNTRIVISDVDGTITKSDVLGQFMPLVGRDWTHSGIARLFSAIKENGYQLLFLSARAIVQAYLTKSFLFNLKQDGKSLPNGPVVISPDGLFPSLYREVIRRAPHEFKIACLEDIKALFPSDYNPFYAGFGNRDTDELSYRRIGIPKGKIFIINPKGEVAINHRIDVKSYTSLHTLVHDMFPPTSLVEQEDFNSWNYWKMPLPDIDNS